MKRIVFTGVIILVCLSMIGCGNAKETAVFGGQAKDLASAIENLVVKSPQQKTIVYKNTQYGFEFTLPASWKDYKIVESKWEGVPPGGETPVESGPIISIRHPLWTEENPRQDIPIMIITIAQWDALQSGQFHIGAAPVGPSELGRNIKYVFALPARYNYAFPAGFEEVETILKGKPLKATEPAEGVSQ